MAITKLNLANGVTGVLPSANGGGLVKISTTSISSSADQIDFDDLFSATYNKYFVVANDLELSGNAALQLYVIIGGSAISADYSTASQAYDAGGTSRSYGNTGLSRIAINSAANYSGATYRHSLQFYIANPLGTDQWKTINGVYGSWTDQAANTAEVGNFSAGYRGATTALSGIRIATSNSATFEDGDVTLYGVAS